MSENTLYVFSAKRCANCGPYKAALDQRGITFKEVDVDTDEGAQKASQHGVRGLPTSLVEGPNGETLFIQAGTGALSAVAGLMGS